MKKINMKGPVVSNDTAWVYEWFGLEACCPNTIANGLAEAAGDDVVIEINSPGGVCVYGSEMRQAIKNYDGHVTAHVISAMSAATIVACACDEVLISDTGIFMIHNSQSTAAGDYRDMQQTADALKQFNDGIINAYMDKTGMSKEEIQSLMDENTYMGPERAIELGFVDGYIDKKKEDDLPENFALGVVAAEAPVIPEEKAAELKKVLAILDNDKSAEILEGIMNGLIADGSDDVTDEITAENELNSGAMADSEYIEMKGERIMTLNEFLAECPEAQAEIDEMMANAENKGVMAERNRLQSLDAISATVSEEMLNEAKYGEKPCDGRELAYQAMVAGQKTASAYMRDVVEDAAEAGVNEVGAGAADEEETVNESDELAGYVNKKGAK